VLILQGLKTLPRINPGASTEGISIRHDSPQQP